MNCTTIFHLLFYILLPFTFCAQKDNVELQKMFDEDQQSRLASNINWTLLTRQDKERENRIYELIKAGEINTGTDYYNSAMIFQHGEDTISSSMAIKYITKAIELDSTVDKWLLAAAIDRDLMKQKNLKYTGHSTSKFRPNRDQHGNDTKLIQRKLPMNKENYFMLKPFNNN